MVKRAKKSASPRLNLRLPPELLCWAKEYAKKTNTTVTKIVTDHLLGLRKTDTEVPQV